MGVWWLRFGVVGLGLGYCSWIVKGPGYCLWIDEL